MCVRVRVYACARARICIDKFHPTKIGANKASMGLKWNRSVFLVRPSHKSKYFLFPPSEYDTAFSCHLLVCFCNLIFEPTSSPFKVKVKPAMKHTSMRRVPTKPLRASLIRDPAGVSGTDEREVVGMGKVDTEETVATSMKPQKKVKCAGSGNENEPSICHNVTAICLRMNHLFVTMSQQFA